MSGDRASRRSFERKRHHPALCLDEESEDAEVADSLNGDHQREACGLTAGAVPESPRTGTPEVAQDWHDSDSCDAAVVA